MAARRGRGLALLLLFIGLKLLGEDFLRARFNLKLPGPVLLGIAGVLLLGAAGAPRLWPKK